MKSKAAGVVNRLIGSPRRAFAASLLLALVAVAGPIGHKLGIVSAACPSLGTTYGSVTSTVNVPANGDYIVWSRMMAPDATNDSYTLEVDGSRCGIVVGGNGISTTSWTWTNKNSAGATITLTGLTAGNHTFVMTGTKPNVKLDRVILTTDTTCTPDNTKTATHEPGDNCTPPPDVDPPDVTITAPAAGQTAPVTATVNVTATDVPSGVQRVELWVDGAYTGLTDTTPAYSFSYNTSGLSVGTHFFVAKAWDNAGNGPGSSSAVGFVVPDRDAPTNVTVTQPTSGSTKRGTIQLSGTALDNVAPTKMEFLFDSETTARTGVVDTTGPSPFAVSFDTTSAGPGGGLSDGTHTVKAKAYDAAGNSALSPAVSFTVDNVPDPVDNPPTVQMQRPAAGEVIKDTYQLSAIATDDKGISKVEFYVDGQLRTPAATIPPYTYSLDTKNPVLSNGSHQFFAKAYDTGGHQVQSTTVTATVNNVTFFNEDINQDGCVNSRDFSLLVGKFGQNVAPGTREDINGNGIVNSQDFSLLVGRFGQCST